MEVVSLTTDFDFSLISLADPEPLNGNAGFYFTHLNVGDHKKSLCLQLPQCSIKQGVVNIKNGKYVDLMFERINHTDLTNWIERLEYTCQDILDEKKELWFQTELSRDDIEAMMSHVIRLYQSGKYVIMRVLIESKGENKCISYDEKEYGFDLDTLEPNQTIVPLVMLEGVKFSSRTFEISLKLIEVMVLDINDKKRSSLIKRDYIKKNDYTPKNLEELSDIQTPSYEVTKVIEQTSIEKCNPLPIANTNTLSKNDTTSISLLKKVEIEKKPNDIEEVKFDYNDINNDTITLKKPNEVYYKMYQTAREKGKQCRIKSIESFLEAKHIKKQYMLYDIDNESGDSFESDESD